MLVLLNFKTARPPEGEGTPVIVRQSPTCDRAIGVDSVGNQNRLVVRVATLSLWHGTQDVEIGGADAKPSVVSSPAREKLK